MGIKYPGNGDSGYNASPPPDDGTAVPSNLVTWTGIKGKLTDILLTYIDAINSDLNDWADNAPNAKSSAYPTVADDNGRVIQTTGSPTITLGTASSMGAGYEVTIKAVSGTTTVATGETIDGSASDRTIAAGLSETYVVNSAGSAYMVKSDITDITQYVPAGAVMAFAMETPPTNWLECDGSAVSRTTYADLFTAVGEVFGVGDGSTTFNLPDLRGQFIRGWDNGAGVDPEAATRLDSGDGSTTGDHVGTTQNDDFKSHTHTGGIVSGSTIASGANFFASGASGLAGGTETRPKNVYMMYCIKY